MTINNVSIDSVADYIANCRENAVDQRAEEKFHRSHPRYTALTRMSGKILDIGSGDGGMGQLLSWPVKQSGKSLVGCDLTEIASLPKGYSDWVSGGWENIPSEMKFGGILAIHVIEHLTSWKIMLQDALTRMENDAYIYIEWPSSETVTWPPAPDIWKTFIELNAEFTAQLLSTFNFYDDDSHTDKPPSMAEVRDALSTLEVVDSGTIFLPENATLLVSKGLRDQSKPNVTMGIWAQFGFAQYILAKK